MFEYFQFLFSTAGAACLAVFFFDGLRRDLSEKGFPKIILYLLSNKPFICPLCLGFYIAPFVWWHFHPHDAWHAYLVHSFSGAAFAWLFHWKITGED